MLKKKKVIKSKPRIRLIYRESDRSWESVTWGSKTKYGTHPAWAVMKNAAHIDLIDNKKILGANSIIFAINQEQQKFVAQMIGRLVNKYIGAGKPITIEVRDQIIEKIKKYIELTRDMVEKL